MHVGLGLGIPPFKLDSRSKDYHSSSSKTSRTLQPTTSSLNKQASASAMTHEPLSLAWLEDRQTPGCPDADRVKLRVYSDRAPPLHPYLSAETALRLGLRSSTPTENRRHTQDEANSVIQTE
ncbi:centrosomal protein of 170 kDa isoform X1 [Lates japonicus]|uniref:Centrosomal protein of 170 kDa isoform X1 n=1 Tax=Lates japonicus TaxID=270547 RepID=A0AAD3MDK1_LATJO|nr:centrosomal protein of 170 kDa isoform X1 [Lates japonicus]